MLLNLSRIFIPSVCPIYTVGVQDGHFLILFSMHITPKQPVLKMRVVNLFISVLLSKSILAYNVNHKTFEAEKVELHEQNPQNYQEYEACPLSQ